MATCRGRRLRQSVTLELEDEIDLSRGEMLVAEWRSLRRT